MLRSWLLVLVALPAGCASSRSAEPPWVYGISRSAYPAITHSSRSDQRKPDADANAVAYVAILVLPFALDTLLLPVTIPHDVFFVD